MNEQVTDEMRAVAKRIIDRRAGRFHSDDGEVMAAAEEVIAAILNEADRLNDRWLRDRSDLEDAVKLLEYALHLRMHGERAAGGAETWREFDQRCEAFLRKRMGMVAP